MRQHLAGKSAGKSQVLNNEQGDCSVFKFPIHYQIFGPTSMFSTRNVVFVRNTEKWTFVRHPGSVPMTEIVLKVWLELIDVRKI